MAGVVGFVRMPADGAEPSRPLLRARPVPRRTEIGPGGRRRAAMRTPAPECRMGGRRAGPADAVPGAGSAWCAAERMQSDGTGPNVGAGDVVRQPARRAVEKAGVPYVRECRAPISYADCGLAKTPQDADRLQRPPASAGAGGQLPRQPAGTEFSG